MTRIHRLIAVLVGVAAVAAAALMAGGSSQPAALPGLPGFASYTPIAGCLEEIPAPVADSGVRPASLTLPEGSHPIRTPDDPAPGLHVVVYAVPVDLDGFVEHVLAGWPENGWELGRGEREVGEAESVFFLPDKSRYGQFRARSVYCDQNMTEVTLTLGEDVGGSKSP